MRTKGIGMRKVFFALWLCLVFLAGLNPAAMGAGGEIAGIENVSSGLASLNAQMADSGLEFGFGVTNVYLQNVRGGLSKHNKAGRFAGSYDLELTADLQKLFGADGGIIYVHTEGRWSKTDYDGKSVGSVFGVNGDYGGRRSMDVVELWYEGRALDGSLVFRAGKMDLTGGFECHGCPVSFDGSAFANDESAQFLNSALVNNPTIPFPDYALAVSMFYNPSDTWYVSAAAADAQNDARETGFRTTFHDEDYFFYVFEAGITPEFSSQNGPLQGAYRVGLWFDPQPKANSDGSKNYRDDTGVYLSFDQMVSKENSNPEDGQGLGVFFRYGYASSKRNDVTNFVSAGLQYQGLFEGRDDDVLGFGFAHGSMSDSADTTYTDDHEYAAELYYNAQITDCVSVSPLIQYIANPGAVDGVSDAVILGIRTQITF